MNVVQWCRRFLHSRDPDSTDLDPNRLQEQVETERRRQQAELRRLTDEIEHQLAVHDVEERRQAAEQARQSRAQSREDLTRLYEEYRRALVAGTTRHWQSVIHRSGEARALRLHHLLLWVIGVGLPVLIACAAYASTGVQAGLARWLDLEPGTPRWWASWLVEPAFATVVCGIILFKAVIVSCGGATDWKLEVVKWGFLGGSIALTVADHPAVFHASGWIPAIGYAVMLSLGSIATAVVAWLMGLMIRYISEADPWRGASSVADLLDPSQLRVLRQLPELLDQPTQPTQQSRPGGAGDLGATRSDAGEGTGDVQASSALVRWPLVDSPTPAGVNSRERDLTGVNRAQAGASSGAGESTSELTESTPGRTEVVNQLTESTPAQTTGVNKSTSKRGGSTRRLTVVKGSTADGDTTDPVVQRAREALDELGVASEAARAAWEFAQKNGYKVSQAALAEALGITPAGVSRALKPVKATQGPATAATGT